MAQPRVAVDAMGGDHGPAVVVEGAVLREPRARASRCRSSGPAALLQDELARLGRAGGDRGRRRARRRRRWARRSACSTLKKRSSIQVGARAGARRRGRRVLLRREHRRLLDDRQDGPRHARGGRPAGPRRGRARTAAGRTVLLDVGANAQCKARHLEEFAIMGSAYARGVLHVARPRVGLMSLGEEETKGNELVRDVHEVLKASRLNFVGNVEGHDLFTGRVDVVVMDGFTGNVVLKACETLAEFVIDLIREEVGRDLRRRLGAWLPEARLPRRPAAQRPGEVGGAPLLGVKGCCVIGHGRSTARAVKHGIRAAAEFHTSGVNARDRGGAARRSGRARRRRAHERRLRVPRPGLAAGRDGAGPRRGLPGEPRRLRRGRRRPRLRPLAALLRGPGGRPPAHREHAAGHPRRQRRRAAPPRGARARARLGGRPQPRRVLGARGRRRALAWPTRCGRCAGAGELMQEAVPVGVGAMAAILGLDLPGDRAGLPGGRARARSSRPANVNSPGPGRDRRARGRRRAGLRALPGGGARSARSGCRSPPPSTARS